MYEKNKIKFIQKKTNISKTLNLQTPIYCNEVRNIKHILNPIIESSITRYSPRPKIKFKTSGIYALPQQF